jgi:branched-chain amino acid transport system substrate-binding protein
MKRSIAALVLATGLATSLAFAGGALAQSKLDKVVKVGSLGDQSGLYQDIGGPALTSPRRWRSRIPGCWPKAGRST